MAAQAPAFQSGELPNGGPKISGTVLILVTMFLATARVVTAVQNASRPAGAIAEIRLILRPRLERIMFFDPRSFPPGKRHGGNATGLSHRGTNVSESDYQRTRLARTGIKAERHIELLCFV
jgi:hypothetical protein